MQSISKIKKKSKRKILVLSGASANSGLQCLYANTQEHSWSIIDFAPFPYPKHLKTEFASLADSRTAISTLKRLSALDHQLTEFATKCAVEFLDRAPKPVRSPDVIAYKPLSLYTGPGPSDKGDTIWNLTLGDPYALATALDTPVLSGFARQDILSGGSGATPTYAGDVRIAKKAGNVAALANIGIVAHLTVVESWRPAIIVDMDTGPGTWLIDQMAKRAGNPEGFDRDGSKALEGSVNADVLESLLSNTVLSPSPETLMNPGIFDPILDHEGLATLSDHDQVATVTALTARTLANAYKKACTSQEKPDTLWISGGGSNNNALCEYLEAYFSPLKIRNIETLGVPTEGKLPLALALSIHDWIDGKNIWPQGRAKPETPLGRWAIV